MLWSFREGVGDNPFPLYNNKSFKIINSDFHICVTRLQTSCLSEIWNMIQELPEYTLTNWWQKTLSRNMISGSSQLHKYLIRCDQWILRCCWLALWLAWIKLQTWMESWNVDGSAFLFCSLQLHIVLMTWWGPGCGCYY